MEGMEKTIEVKEMTFVNNDSTSVGGGSGLFNSFRGSQFQSESKTSLAQTLSMNSLSSQTKHVTMAIPNIDDRFFFSMF